MTWYIDGGTSNISTSPYTDEYRRMDLHEYLRKILGDEFVDKIEELNLEIKEVEIKQDGKINISLKGDNIFRYNGVLNRD